MLQDRTRWGPKSTRTRVLSPLNSGGSNLFLHGAKGKTLTKVFNIFFKNENSCHVFQIYRVLTYSYKNIQLTFLNLSFPLSKQFTCIFNFRLIFFSIVFLSNDNFLNLF